MKTNSEIRRVARESLSGNWGKSILAFIVYLAIIGGLSATGLGSFIALVIVPPFAFGIALFFLNLVRKNEIAVSQIFKGFNHFGKTLIIYILVNIYVILWSLLLIIPGIIAGYKYSMTYYILVDNPEISASEAITKSKEMMNGNKAKLFWLLLSFIGWYFLSIISGGIGFIWLVPYVSASTATFYEDIKPQTEVTAETVE